ncbi:penicillin-binding protein [Rhodovibrio sodomensis]|uniref:Penicillin-binding protein n=1 Tax=Rhodovibrio sodomensis TaxID=1088 RepID=A0ABS1DB41_9PROT|nr:penicillin-binding protein 2 [Rhodovibrio sodomensis]MBK1666813.1 penicillin-binding protein [Rhodovibrio sodomensis]
MSRRRNAPCAPHDGTQRPAGPVRRALRLDGTRKEVLETGRTRLLVAGIVFAVAFSAIGVRVLDLAVLNGGDTRDVATRADGPPPVQTRADIVDRNGHVLATTLPVAALYAEPREVDNPAQVAHQLAPILTESTAAELQALLDSAKSFVWLDRNLTPRQQYRVNRLGIPALHFKQSEKRFYPYGELTAHAVGYTNVDGKGIAGIEQSFNQLLKDSNQPLKLSLDVRVQHILMEELRAKMQEFEGIGAAGLVMDVRTGELLALASLPTYNPHEPGRASDDARFNRATLGIYEMGSTFKIFSTAAALETNAVSLFDKFDVSEPIRKAGFTIRDYKSKDGKLTVPQIFMHSSNIGTVKMAMETGTEVQRNTLRDLGLTRPVTLEIPEVGTPMVPNPWREISTVTVSYGHGIAVNAVQLASAVGATVNHGRRHAPTLLKRDPSDVGPGTRVFSAKTSRQMRKLMRLVVEYGTGKNADAYGYRVGGKTGTADKPDHGGYGEAQISSFVGAFPMDDPRYVVFAMIDEPKGQEHTYGYATGGWVAAPVVKHVIERMGPLLGIEPRPVKTPEKENHPLLVNALSEDERVASN